MPWQTPGFEDVPPWARLLALGVALGFGAALFLVGRFLARNGRTAKVAEVELKLEERWAAAERQREAIRGELVRVTDVLFGRAGRPGLEDRLDANRAILDSVDRRISEAMRTVTEAVARNTAEVLSKAMSQAQGTLTKIDERLEETERWVRKTETRIVLMERAMTDAAGPQWRRHLPPPSGERDE